MKNSVFPFLLSALCIFCFQCDKTETPPNPTPAVEFSCMDQPTVCDLTGANGNFAIDLFKSIHDSEAADANVFISPFSISVALSMTVNGANGQTLSEMQEALRTGALTLEELNTAYQVLLEILPQLDPATRLKLANSIWHQTDYPVIPAFLETNSTYYNSEIIPVDFRAEGVVDEVNAWVEENTDGLIQEALNTLPPGVVMLLINAIYFQGSWQTEFDPENTVPSTFSTPNGQVDVDMMHLPEDNIRYFENEIFQAVDLPYGDSIYSMSLFLPKEGFTLDQVINELNPENWENWLSAFQPTNLELYMPKFELEYETKLKGTLSGMGMERAFSDFADFSQMIEGGGVKIDDVIHKAFLTVDEEGTEAAAVTVVIIVETSAPLIPTFKADHPFLFVIHDNKTRSILFMGKLQDPS